MSYSAIGYFLTFGMDLNGNKTFTICKLFTHIVEGHHRNFLVNLLAGLIVYS